MLDKIKNLLPHRQSKFKRFVEKYKYYIVAVMSVLIVTLLVYTGDDRDNKTPIQINNRTVYVETADTYGKQAKGLMYRKKLNSDEGMLFIYTREGKHTFWMKNTLIPLDIIWLNSQKEVVHIEHSAPPCKSDPCPTFVSEYPARYVLELNGGWSISNDLDLGDRVSF